MVNIFDVKNDPGNSQNRKFQFHLGLIHEGSWHQITLKDIEKYHFKNSNKIYKIKLKNFLRDGVILSYYGFFILIGFFSKRLAFNLFENINEILKKIPFLNKLSRK